MVLDFAECPGELRDGKTAVVPRQKDGCVDYLAAHAAEHVDQFAELRYVLRTYEGYWRTEPGIASRGKAPVMSRPADAS